MSKILRAGLGALLALGCTPVLAASPQTTTFTVTANVVAGCTITAATLDFGAYVPTATSDTDASSTVTTNCTLTVPYNIGLNVGAGAGATVAARKMTSGANTLTYSLFRDAGHLLVWGDTIGTDTVAPVGFGLAVPTTVFGRIPASQNAAVGSYTDTITATLTF